MCACYIDNSDVNTKSFIPASVGLDVENVAKSFRFLGTKETKMKKMFTARLEQHTINQIKKLSDDQTEREARIISQADIVQMAVHLYYMANPPKGAK